MLRGKYGMMEKNKKEVVMKKIFIFCLAILFASVVAACAMGPIYNGAKTATWDAVSGAGGYFVYWRTPGTQT